MWLGVESSSREAAYAKNAGVDAKAIDVANVKDRFPIYHKSVSGPDASVQLPDLGVDVEWFVDLGEVRETAQVFLNGRDLGAAWKGTRRLPCGDALKRGANDLRIEVANLWIPHVLAHPPGDPARHLKGVGADPAVAETAGIRWGTYGEVPAEKVPPSGLLGPVRLVAMKRVRLQF